jgi:hypothetical protein
MFPVSERLAAGDNVLWSIMTAIDGWSANRIRLPVNNDS